jgi:hypothetical protein
MVLNARDLAMDLLAKFDQWELHRDIGTGAIHLVKSDGTINATVHLISASFDLSNLANGVITATIKAKVDQT